jgi:hypothetical protein
VAFDGLIKEGTLKRRLDLVSYPAIAGFVLTLTVCNCTLWAQAQKKDPTPRIQDARPRGKVSEDPVVKTSSSKTAGVLPPAALRAPGIGEQGEEAWESAKWQHSTINFSRTSSTNLSIAAPSVLLVRATWKQNFDVSVSVLQGATVLASATTQKAFDGLRSATIQVKVPAGPVVVKASSTAPGPIPIELYTGILAAAK